jgi:hypothetical protein
VITALPGKQYDCPRCGQFVICDLTSQELPVDYRTPQRREVLSHRLRCRLHQSGNPPLIYFEELPEWGLDEPLPSPAEQADRLIVWIGDRQPSPREKIEPSASAISAWIGAAITQHSPTVLNWLLSQEEIGKLVERTDGGGRTHLQLKMAGWERYEAIKKGRVESSTAFMAMKFGDKELSHAFNDHFKQAVARAGFELRLLTEGQPAGLIDDQLRVRLRTSRFVIADLSHNNNGAYWEAGFAEGLGRPVIYTCREDVWNGRDEQGKSKVHFDTSHLVTIIWDPANLKDAATRLTATIRATLPAEAKMTDQ